MLLPDLPENFDEAISTYDKALLIAPDNSIILNNLAKAKTQSSLSDSQISNNDISEKTLPTSSVPQNNAEKNSPNFFEQLGIAFSSIFDIFN